MARNKRPALTSPWKIGFLVSLLLVAVSIGVGYLITRSFGLTWSWIEFHGTWNDFTFRQDVFMTEMLPLAVAVAAMALVAYLSITGAVRKYRRYLDSGADYKRLIQTLSKIDNLNDEAPIRKLSNYPDLRDFLLNLRSGILEREKALEERETALGAKDTADADDTTSETLGKEVDVLISAIMAGPDGGFQRELALTVPELKRVEEAVRDNLMAGTGAKAQEELETLRAEADRKAAALRDALDEIQEEVAQGERDARDLEAEMGTLRAHANAAAPAAGSGEEIQRAVGRLDSISDVLRALGEETRSVAINTALEATSADASGDSVVKLADGVRDVAAKFNGVAAEWEEASGMARTAIASTDDASGPSPRLGESLDSLSHKVSRWAERSVILAEKVRTLQNQTTTAPAAAAPDTANEQPSKEDWSIETTATKPVTESAPAPAVDSDDFETTSAPVTLDADAATPAVDTSGFEKQEGLFSELATPAGESTEMFADIPTESETPSAAQPSLETTDVDLPAPEAAGGQAEEPAAPKEYVIDEEPAAPKEYVIDDEPAGLNGDTADSTPEADPVPEEPGYEGMITGPRPSTTTRTGTDADADAAAVDLYDLGAVDYESENVHHNA